MTTTSSFISTVLARPLSVAALLRVCPLLMSSPLRLDIRSPRDDVHADLDVAVHRLRVRADLMGQLRDCLDDFRCQTRHAGGELGAEEPCSTSLPNVYLDVHGIVGRQR